MRYNSKEDYKLITRFHKDLLDPIEINGVLMPDRPTVTAEVNGVVKTDLRPIMGEDVAYAMELFCNLWLWCPECTWANTSPWYLFGLLEGRNIDNFWKITESSGYNAGPSCYHIARTFLRHGWNDLPGYDVDDNTGIFEFASYRGIPNGRCILVNDDSKCIGIHIEETYSHDLWMSLHIRIHSGRTYEKNGRTYYTAEYANSSRMDRVTYDGPYISSNGKLIVDATYTGTSGVQEYRAEINQNIFSASMHQVVGVLKQGEQTVGDVSVYEVGDCSNITTNNAIVQQSSSIYDYDIVQFFISGGFNFDIMKKRFDYTFINWRDDREKERWSYNGSKYPLTARELKWGLDNIGIYNNLIISGTCEFGYFVMNNGDNGYVIDSNEEYAVGFTKQRVTLRDDLSGVDSEYSSESSDHYIIHIGMASNVKALIQLNYSFYNTIEDPHFNAEYITYTYDVEKFRTKDANGLDILDIYAPTFFNDIRSFMNTRFNYKFYADYYIDYPNNAIILVGSFNYGT